MLQSLARGGAYPLGQWGDSCLIRATKLSEPFFPFCFRKSNCQDRSKTYEKWLRMSVDRSGSFTAWQETPSNSSAADCVAIATATSLWRQRECGASLPFICSTGKIYLVSMYVTVSVYSQLTLDCLSASQRLLTSPIVSDWAFCRISCCFLQRPTVG